MHKLCASTYFYIVDNGNAWVNNRTEHKKMVYMIYVAYFSYVLYIHQIMVMMIMSTAVSAVKHYEITAL